MGSTSIITRGGANPLLDYLLHGGLGIGQLGIGAALLAIALGYASYTDMFRGMIIPNGLNLGIWAGGLAGSALLFVNEGGHLEEVGILTGVIFILYLLRIFAEGDLKLYAALATLFGKGMVILMIASWMVTLVYGLPSLIKHQTQRRQGKASGLTKVPAGPGIAVAYPITMYLAGVKMSWCAVLLILEVVTVLVSLFFADLNRRADDYEAAQRAEDDAHQASASEDASEDSAASQLSAVRSALTLQQTASPAPDQTQASASPSS